MTSIEKVDGGYGKGYIHAMTHWRKIVTSSPSLRNQRNMMVVLLAHAKVERFEDPEEADLRPLLAAAEQTCRSADFRMVRCRAFRHAEIRDQDGDRRF